MIQYEYSRNTVHVTYTHVYSHNVQSPCVGLRSAVGSVSDCKSRGCEFGPQPGHITFKEIDPVSLRSDQNHYTALFGSDDVPLRVISD